MKNSIIIPVHNESQNLELFIDEFLSNLQEIDLKNLKEVLLIENGSSDNTFEVCKKIEEKHKNVIKAVTINKPSYGEAIKYGMLIANAEIVTILECDFLLPEFNRESRELIEKGADFVIASKRHKKSIDERPLKRRIITFLFNYYLKVSFKFPGSDTHGLKAIESKKAKKLCDVSITTDEAFQTEIVLLAHKFGYNVTEIPVKIKEKRTALIKIHKRLPKVWTIINELKKSLSRY